MLFWCATGGYTTDVSKAAVYKQDHAQAKHDVRPTDIPWPKEYIDSKTRPVVDMQYVKREEALRDTGIVLVKPKKDRNALRCICCNRFLSIRQMFLEDCPNCGQDNRP